jgi:hypothetical protein
VEGHSVAHGIFHAYGLFWRLDEINWTPGKGRRREFRLLGRRGAYRPGIQIADFRHNPGIYILYGNYGPHYAGLTRRQSLGKRLKDHLGDDHGGKWDRFSWFSFQRVLKAKDKAGLQAFGDMPDVRSSDPAKAMKDIEALLIKAMAMTNIAQMNFSHANEWIQIRAHEADHYLQKL